jgi:beta-galactosidase
MIRLYVTDTGTLAGVANGDPASHEANVADPRQAYRGLCLVLVRVTDHAGSVTIHAQASGLRPAEMVLHTVGSGLR